MKEEYLHYLFRTKQLGSDFVTTNNESIEVVNFGFHNHNAGPDFLECQIKYDHKIWAGQIEFHVKSSDWLKHKHQFDSNYNNVIAHFVYEHDLEIESGKYTLPTIELKSLINQNHFIKYKTYLKSRGWIPCEKDISRCDEFTVYQQKENAVLSRLFRKSEIVLDLIEKNNGDRKKAFIILLFKAFGTKVNKSAFEMLGERFDWKIISKLNNDSFKIQAYLFGLAGFLEGPSIDEYHLSLQVEFKYLKKLYSLSEMSHQEWKFSAMRPSNLPTVRIAQLTQLLSDGFSVSNSFELIDLKPLLKTELNGYWKTHYMFAKVGKRKNSGLSNDFVDLISINVFVPYFFSIGILQDDESLKQKAFSFLEGIKAEKNSIIQNWKKLSIPVNTAFDSQALIEQKNEFCDKKLCLKCKVGLKLLKT